MTAPENERVDVEPSSTDAIYEILSESRRRRILALLADDDRSLTLNDLAEELIAEDREEPISEVSGREMRRIATTLHHAHLPKLADHGIVTYDTKRRLVEPTDALSRIEPYLDVD